MWWNDLIFTAAWHHAQNRTALRFPVDGWTLMLTNGELMLRIVDAEQPLTGCVFWAVPPGGRAIYRPRARGGAWHETHLRLSGATPPLWQAAGLIPEVPQQIANARITEPVFQRVVLWTGRQGAWAHPTACTTLQNILVHLAAGRAGTHGVPAWLRELQSRLDHGRVGDFDAVALARDLGWSPATLRRRFRAETGISLRSYAIRARMIRASTLLAETTRSVADIAAELGYSSESFFSRQFRACHQRNPAAVRREPRRAE